MPPLPLFRRFILRALAREKARSLVAVVGVAAGVAVMIAIRLANASVTDTFRAAVDAVGGSASVRVRGTTGRFDELRLRELDWLADEGAASPVIDAYAMVAKEAPTDGATGGIFPRGELLRVLGVDVLRDFELRDYHVLRTGRGERQSATEVLGLLKDPYSIILTEKLLRRRGLRVGDTIRLTFASTPHDYRIRGVLLNKGPAKTLDGSFALMDIAAAQLSADRLGFVDYVDVHIPEDADLDATLKRIQERLPAGIVAELPNASFGRTDTMLSAFQFNLEALSSVALIVGLFLIYNTLAISVAARRGEIGLLQAAGAGRRVVLMLFLGEAALLTTVGVAIGLPLGRLLASYAVQGAAQTVETFYIAGVAESSAGSLRLTAADVLGALGLITPLAMLAAAIPAWDAASTPPIEAAREGSHTPRRIGWKLVAVAAATFAVGGLLTLASPIDGKPVFGFLAQLLFMAGGAMLTPVVVTGVCRGGGRLLTAVAPGARTELRLATANLVSSLPRVSVSVAALAVSLSMMVAIAVMVGSFRETMTYWLESALSADLAVKPVMQSSSVSEERLSRRAIETLRSDKDVIETLWITSRQLPLAGQTLRLGVTEIPRVLGHAGLMFKAPVDRTVLDAVDWSDRVMVSEPYALKFGVGVGDKISLPAPAGMAELTVAAVYFDYASSQGTVLVDAATYTRFYAGTDPDPAPSNLSLYLREGTDPQEVRDRLLGKLGSDEQLYCVTNGEIRNEAMRIFESTFAVTYALQAIAILIAGLGVASTLITLIYQRQREIGLLSLVGATFAQVKRIVLWEAVLLGAASQAMGIGIGLLLAYVLIYVINVQSFGWTIQFHLPWSFLALSSLTVVAAAALFGWYPAVKAAGGNPLQTVREQ